MNARGQDSLRAVRLIALCIAGFSVLAFSAPGRAAADDCRLISRIPFAIEQSGTYCLPPDPLYYAQGELRSAILVQADDVTIDLGGHVLAGPRKPDRLTEGIYSAGYRNLTVKNGTIDGFMFGIRIEPRQHETSAAGSYRFTGLTIAGSSYRGIAVALGSQRGDVTIADNVIVRTGGTTFMPDSFAIGIEIAGAGTCRIEGNQVLDTMPVGVGEGAAISVSGDNQGCLVQKNYLANSARPDGTRTMGFRSTDWHPLIVFRENVVSNFAYPSAGLAEGDCRVIERIPFVIKASGRYCLPSSPLYHAQDQLRSAILVQADDVTIDLGGHVLAGPRKADQVSEGIYSAGYRNLTVKNGTIDGFMFGIRIVPPLHDPAAGGFFRFTGLTIADSSFRGIFAALGKHRGDVTIADNVIARTGSTTFVPDSYAIGIEISGATTCRIEGNQVLDTMPVGLGEGAAISMSGGNESCLVKKNYLANSARPQWGRTMGFWTTDSHPAIVFRENVVHNFTYGAFDNGNAIAVWNTFDSNDCTPKNTPGYYTAAFRKMNDWIEEEPSCSDTPQSFLKAARAGDPRAQYRMAKILNEGIAMKARPAKESQRWLKLAANQGLQIAARELSISQKAASRLAVSGGTN